MRSATLACLALLVTAAPAGAATFGELPFTPADGVATCLRATGEPGGLAQIGPLGRNSTAIDLFRPDGALAGRVSLGLLTHCPSVAEAGGTAVVAGTAADEARTRLRAAIRDAGGAFGRPVTLARGGQSFEAHSAAIARSGAAVVAWIQSSRRGERVVAFRRAPGGGFGPLEALTRWRSTSLTEGVRPVTAIADDGGTTVAWTRSTPAGEMVTETASARAGTPFGPPQPLQPAADQAGIAISQDGALIVTSGRRAVTVFERRAGGFAATARFDLPDFVEAAPAVVAGEHGAAAVAWRGSEEGSVLAVARAAGGAFGEPQRVAPGRDTSSGFGLAEPLIFFAPGERGPFAPFDTSGRDVRLAAAADGRLVLSWLERLSIGGDRVEAPRVAAGTYGDGFGRPEPLGGTVRVANATAPLVLGDGRLAVAWTDNHARAGLFGLPRARGRRHVAIEGAPAAPTPPQPTVRVTVRRGQRLHEEDPLRVRIRCSSACDLRALALRGRATMVAEGNAYRSRAGVARLRLRPGPFRPLPPWATGRVTVAVRASAPGAATSATTRVPVRVVPRPVPPFAAPSDVAARRVGRRIVVTWRTERPARRVTFEAMPLSEPEAADGMYGGGRRSFRVVLKPRRPGAVRRVSVRATARDSPYRTRTVTVRVSR